MSCLHLYDVLSEVLKTKRLSEAFLLSTRDNVGAFIVLNCL